MWRVVSPNCGFWWSALFSLARPILTLMDGVLVGRSNGAGEDGWVARWWLDGAAPVVAVRHETKGCLVLTPESLAPVVGNEARRLRTVAENTTLCRAEPPTADVDRNGIPDGVQPLFRARNDFTGPNGLHGRVYVERNVVASEARGGVSDYDDDGDGWAVIGRTNGSQEDGRLVEFTVNATTGVPEVRVQNDQRGCVTLVPASLEAVRGGGARLMNTIAVVPGACVLAPRVAALLQVPSTESGVGDIARVEVTSLDQYGQIVGGVPVTLTGRGANLNDPTELTAMTGPDGKHVFTWVGTVQGTDDLYVTGLSGVTPAAATVTWTAAVTIDGVNPGRMQGVQTIRALVGSAAVASVEVVLDGAVVRVLSAPEYAVALDTTGWAEGPHTLGIKARDAAGVVLGIDQIDIYVNNRPDFDEVLLAEVTAGMITPAQYALAGARQIATGQVDPKYIAAVAELPERESDTGRLMNYMAGYDVLDPATKASIDALFPAVPTTRPVRSQATGRLASAAALQAQATTSPTCPQEWSIGGCEVNLPPRTYRGIQLPLIQVGWYEDLLCPNTGCVDNRAIAGRPALPDYVDDLISSVEDAYATYVDLGFSLGSQDRVQIRLDGGGPTGRPFTQPGGWHAIHYYQSGNDPYLVRHELFHVFQWKYTSLRDYRNRAGWWMEATAEWADQQVMWAAPGGLCRTPLRAEYVSRTCEGAARFPVDLSTRASIDAVNRWLSDPSQPLAERGGSFGLDKSRAYGMYPLAHWLTENIEPGFVLETFKILGRGTSINPFDDEETAIDAISERLAAVAKPGLDSRAAAFPRMWLAMYRMTNGANPYGFANDQTPKWAAELPARPAGPVGHSTYALRDGETKKELFAPGQFGAKFIDLNSANGVPGTYTVRLRGYGRPTHDGLHVESLVARWTIRPNLCATDPIIQGTDSGTNEETYTIRTTPTCPTATLAIVAMKDDNFEVEVSFRTNRPALASCGINPNADFADRLQGWSTDYTAGDLWSEGTYAIGPTLLDAAPTWGQYVISNFGAQNVTPKAAGKVLFINAASNTTRRVLYRDLTGLITGQEYKLTVPMRKLVTNGNVRIVINGIVKADQPISALTTGTWTDVTATFTPTEGVARVEFVLRETTGASFGADFAASNLSLTRPDGTPAPLACR